MATLFEQEGRPYRPELLMEPEDVAAKVVCALALLLTAEVTDIGMRPLLKCTEVYGNYILPKWPRRASVTQGSRWSSAAPFKS